MIKEKRDWVLCAFIWVGLLLYAFSVLYTHYLSGSYAFFDLTLISEFLANTAYGRGFFQVPEYGFSHLKIHFTPSLIFLTPLFRLFDSQFLLLSLNICGIFLSFIIFLVLVRRITEISYPDIGRKLPPWFAVLLPAIFLILMSTNRYTKNFLTSTSPWFVYPAMFGFLAWMVLKDRSYGSLIVLLILTLGIRQDIGMFLGFQLGALYFLPGIKQVPFKMIRKKIIILSLVSFGIFIFLNLWALPRFGAISHVNRGWGHYGASWSQVFFAVLTSPVRVLSDILESGFLSFNTSFFWLPALNPIVFLLCELPGVLFYLSEEPAKKFLWYYNSGLILPGVYIASWVGMCQLLTWFKSKHAYAFLLLIVPINILTIKDSHGFKYLPLFKISETKAVRSLVYTVLTKCAGVSKVASDFRTAAYLPNRYERVLLHHFQQADVVFIDPEFRREPGNFANLATARNEIQKTGEYAEMQIDGCYAYVKKNVVCRDLQKNTALAASLTPRPGPKKFPRMALEPMPDLQQ